MARRSRHIDEARAGKLEHVGEILSADDAPYLPPEPVRNRHGDNIVEVIPQSVWGQDQILEHFRQAGLARDIKPRTRAVGVRHHRSLRRVFE